MKRTLLVTILSVVCGATAFAGDGIDRAAESGFTLRKHEIAAGGSFIPGNVVHDFGMIPGNGATSYDNAWWLSYTYNFTKLFALQFSVTYDGFNWENDPIESGGILYSGHEFYITPMLTFRVSWLNRKLVRLYSSAGIGLLIDSDPWYTTNSKGETVKRRCDIGWQVTACGISVGKKLYGYAELGVGTQYAIGCAGIGYRF